MEDLADAVPSLQNLVARPGTFASFFPETTDDHLLSILIDGLAECHLERLLLDYNSDEDGLLTPALTSGQAALVTLFAANRFLRAELINRNTSVTYEAPGVRYETTQATNILRDIMKELKAQRDRLIQIGNSGSAASVFLMADQYLARIAYRPVYSDYALAGW